MGRLINFVETEDEEIEIVLNEAISMNVDSLVMLVVLMCLNTSKLYTS